MKRKYAITAEGTRWREQLAERQTQWANKNLDEVHQAIESYVYEESLNGAKLSSLALKFGVKREDFDVAYGDVWRLGQAELQSLIAMDTLEYGLKSQIPVAKIWMGKSLGGLSDNGSQSTAVETESDDGTVNIKVNIVRKEE